MVHFILSARVATFLQIFWWNWLSGFGTELRSGKSSSRRNPWGLGTRWRCPRSWSRRGLARRNRWCAGTCSRTICRSPWKRCFCRRTPEVGLQHCFQIGLDIFLLPSIGEDSASSHPDNLICEKSIKTCLIQCNTIHMALSNHQHTWWNSWERGILMPGAPYSLGHPP